MKNTNLLDNIILSGTDSYKLSHWLQYPKDTRNVFSYVESRGSTISGIDYTVFFNLQPLLKKYLAKPITQADIDFAAQLAKYHAVPFNKEGWQSLLEKHNGKFPLKIKAVKEGTRVPVSNVMLTIEATDPEFFWLPSYFETIILRHIWYGSTVATISSAISDMCKSYLQKTSTGDPEVLSSHMLNDFGARGVSSTESAAIGGAAHLISSFGTDNIGAMLFAIEFYNAEMENLAHSVPAAEHSTMTSWGKSSEADAYSNMLTQYGSEGAIVAVVSDSYDIYNAVKNIWCGEIDLLQRAKEGGYTVVIRPDSGDATRVPVELMQIIAEQKGYTVNEKGYKVLPPYVRIIQADGLDIETIPQLLENVKGAGFSTENIVLGMGGGLLQKCDRDTFKFAMKCSNVRVGNCEVDVLKDPVTDPGKVSKKGRLMLYNIDGEYVTEREGAYGEEFEALETVFLNGDILRDESFSEIRERAKNTY